MITSLTKEQIEKLSVEQRETLARALISEQRNHQALLQRTRPRHVHYGLAGCIIFVSCPVVLIIAYFLPSSWPSVEAHSFLQLIAAILVCFLIGFAVQIHVNGLNRRIDAVLALLDSRLAEKEK